MPFTMGKFGGHASADTAPADEHATPGLAVEDSAAERFGEVGIIVGGIFPKSADVMHVVTRQTQQVAHGVLELKAGVVGTNGNLPARLTFPRLL